MSKGGQIIALGRWTHDAGVGTQDQLVVVTDQGEVITYQGTNPSEASAWQLTGKYQTGLPIGRNVLVKLGGDLGVLTRDGVQAMSKIVTLDRAQADSQGAFTSNIRDRYKIDAALYGSNFGWQATVFPDRNMLLVNVPFQQYTDSYQYVMNVQTGAWTRFLGWNAICFHYFNGALYFGLNAGRIGVTTTELLSTDFGIKITCRLICAFTAIGGRGRGKLVKMIRPVLWSTSTIRYACGMAFDYRLSLATVEAAAQTVGNVNGGLVLAADQILMSWSGASGYGYAIAPTLNIEFQDGDNANFSSSVRLIGFDALVEAGGVL
jgi:hypothetical protein